MTDRESLPDADEPRPWERPGAVRRDLDPHRAGLLLTLGLAAGLLGFFTLYVVVTGLPALPLGLFVWREARRDEAEIRAGRMDPSRRFLVRDARHLAVLGVVCTLLGCALWAMLALTVARL